MARNRMRVSGVGPIGEANIEFGDLTVLVGPQAGGKSIFLELFKLVKDPGAICTELGRHGLDWDRDFAQFLDIFLGEGMRGVWREGISRVACSGRKVDLAGLVARKRRSTKQSVFFIPAQRVLTLNRGWPRPFSDFSAGDPFTVRDFSDTIRLLMERGFSGEGPLFPHEKRLKKQYRDVLMETIFRGYALRIDKDGAQKRLVLVDSKSKTGPNLPYMVWSAGQREFVPLLLGLYWLMPPAAKKRAADIEWVVIEEPEMGLHPRAIGTVLLLVLELLWRDYRVCVSTHSPQLLDLVWTLKVLQAEQAEPESLLDLFQLESPSPNLRTMAQSVLKKEARVYYFDPTRDAVQDISNLDPMAEDRAEARWGGLTEFSGRAAEVVTDVMARAGT